MCLCVCVSVCARLQSRVCAPYEGDTKMEEGGGRGGIPEDQRSQVILGASAFFLKQIIMYVLTDDPHFGIYNTPICM